MKKGKTTLKSRILSKNAEKFSTAKNDLVCPRDRPDWGYEFPDRTGPDTQICREGLNPDLNF